jgi:hypothetical protein
MMNGGCANIIPPEGGYRDSLPPLLLKSSPADSSKNFHSDRIILNFDEYVELNNARENVIMSPLPENDPLIEYKLHTVTIKLKDSLKPNTTYSINMSNVIKDVNEGNILKKFTYVFTTGNYFDSLSVTGKVLLAENGRADSTLIVMLHQSSDDSAVVLKKPLYITRVDKSGNFTFHNLPPGKFYVYALKDEGGTRRYLSPKQYFAFADKPVNTQTDKTPLTLYAYQEGQTSAVMPSLNLGLRRNGANTDKRLRISTNADLGPLDLLSDFLISTEQPLKIYDSTKIHFSTDTTFTQITGSRFILDSTRKKIALHFPWKESTRYNVIVEKDFAEDSLGRKLLKSDTFSFKTRKISDYGELKLSFRDIDLAQNPVILFVQNDIIVRSIPLTSRELNQPLFLPGEYEVRILYDRNKNGKWDPGVFFEKHLQPEIVKPIERKISVRADWVNEIEL